MKEYSPKTIQYYDKIAAEYAVGTAAVVQTEQISKFIGELKAGSVVLDLACGPGHDTGYLITQSLRAIGVDLSTQMLAIAHQSEGSYAVMDFFNLAFGPETFDGVWASSALVHVNKSDLPALLKGIYALLKENGILGIITVKEQLIERSPTDTRAYFMYGKDELAKVLQENGFFVMLNEVFSYGGKDRLFILSRKGQYVSES